MCCGIEPSSEFAACPSPPWPAPLPAADWPEPAPVGSWRRTPKRGDSHTGCFGPGCCLAGRLDEAGAEPGSDLWRPSSGILGAERGRLIDSSGRSITLVVVVAADEIPVVTFN